MFRWQLMTTMSPDSDSVTGLIIHYCVTDVIIGYYVTSVVLVLRLLKASFSCFGSYEICLGSHNV